MDTTYQFENLGKMNIQPNSEAQTANVQMNSWLQPTAVQAEKLCHTTDIYNMSGDPEGEMFPQQFVLQENTPRNTLTPMGTGEEEGQAFIEVLLKQNEELREQLNMQEEESQALQNDMLKVICRLKTQPQAQFEEWKEMTLKHYKEESSLLTSTMDKQRSVIETLQAKSIEQETVVKVLRCKVTEQEETIQELQSRTQTLNLDLQTEGVTFEELMAKSHADHVSALAKINVLTKQVKDSSQENESLRNSFKEQLRTMKQKKEELSEALTTSEETNSALKQENKELQQTLAINEELREQLKRQKAESQACHQDMQNIISGFKTLPQDQFEECKNMILKHHEEEINLLKEEKTSAREAVEKEIDELNAVISKLRRELLKTKGQPQHLLDAKTQKTHQVAALKQNLKEEQMEKEDLKSQVLHLQSSLNQQEQAYKAALITSEETNSALKRENKELREDLTINEELRQEKARRKKRNYIFPIFLFLSSIFFLFFNCNELSRDQNFWGPTHGPGTPQ
ncbi:uncharacterized protein [Eucyclogobius newberryi]|uniref:uncharacterized protein n=1 Tax=Eucyclogobius newberryi TaxID=166745 RepID=UPI003B5C24BF